MGEHISALKGCGKGKSALLIGGGPSASTIPSVGDVRINCNWPHHGERVDYMCYYDRVIEEIHKDDDWDFKTIGFARASKRPVYHYVPDTDYYAEIHEDVQFSDSGYHVLQIACHWMQFDEVFLIGYDYTDVDGSVHYYDEGYPEGFDALERYQRHVFSRALHRYHHAECRCPDLSKCKCPRISIFDDFKITNLSPISKLGGIGLV